MKRVIFTVLMCAGQGELRSPCCVPSSSILSPNCHLPCLKLCTPQTLTAQHLASAPTRVFPISRTCLRSTAPVSGARRRLSFCVWLPSLRTPLSTPPPRAAAGVVRLAFLRLHNVPRFGNAPVPLLSGRTFGCGEPRGQQVSHPSARAPTPVPFCACPAVEWPRVR